MKSINGTPQDSNQHNAPDEHFSFGETDPVVLEHVCLPDSENCDDYERIKAYCDFVTIVRDDSVLL